MPRRSTSVRNARLQERLPRQEKLPKRRLEEKLKRQGERPRKRLEERLKRKKKRTRKISKRKRMKDLPNPQSLQRSLQKSTSLKRMKRKTI